MHPLTRKCTRIVWLSLLTLHGVGQTSAPPFTSHSSAAIQQELITLKGKAGQTPGGYVSEKWESFGDHFTLLAVRVSPGGGEVHVHTGDYFYVLAGHATEIIGGSLVNATETTPGERRGSAVTGGVPHPMGPGDLIHISANTPHQTIPNAGEAFAYLIFKVPE